ncbi:hypothetical protein F5878DRAFT_599873 [Lentinula raphanica]|uniref:U4/U6.U5 small nuclear ribonucleoprotein 27kDa protein domain-containing protein n=1 Tax=Lentinula raphanica TaxID=153919 RepID=A0AA38PLS0_9AGAR|nr:hypothetical protein F5878DRAFT_599873 [Lentinula raphanica]
MSHRDRDHRRRERSWEREDRDRSDKYSRGGRSSYRDEPRRRSSRSRSPRRSERERRDHRDHRRDERRDRDTRRRDDSRERERSRERDRERDRDRETDRRGDGKESSRREVPPPKDSTRSNSPTSKPDSEYSNNAEAGQVPEDDDTAMMAMMGMAGFGSTKGKHVEGNQEGAVNIKKTRTWRQYMNRRGGFNRPLDKIK